MSGVGATLITFTALTVCAVAWLMHLVGLYVDAVDAASALRRALAAYVSPVSSTPVS